MIDILVGMAISMLAMLLILNLSVVFESRRAATVDGSETQINAANIFSMMQRDMRLAGYGLSPMEVWGCTVKRHYINSKMDLTLNPIKIIDGVNGAPDSVQILASSKNESGASYVLINHHPASATTMLLNSNLGLAINDILILQEAGKNCTMFQVTNVANDGIRIKHEGVSSPWNPDLPETLFPKEGYGAASNIINLGKVFDRKYSINNRNELQLENYLSDDDSKSLLTITSNIINLQAQYGFDTSTGLQIPAKVTRWSAVMLDADNNLIVGDNGDLRRILAIRFAIVARSNKKELASPGGCNLSSVPTWRAGNPTTGELENIEIDVSKNSDNSANPLWRCFRYRVYETVVPLRNLMWGQP